MGFELCTSSVIVYPKIVGRVKRSTSENVVQVQINGEDNAMKFSLNMQKNINLVTQMTIVEWHHPNGTKQVISLHDETKVR